MNLTTLISGLPGSGKTYSCRNLGSESVLFNVERKMLPFQNKGLVNVPVKTVSEMFAYLKAMESKDYKVIVIDSFSEFSDKLLTECKAKHKGFEIFSQYNQRITDFFDAVKDIENKYIFILGHTETLNDEEGEKVYRMKAHGRQHENMIEKNATCVFYSKMIRKPEGGVEYKLSTNSDGYTPSKSPYGMFPEILIENDIAQIVKVYDSFYS